MTWASPPLLSPFAFRPHLSFPFLFASRKKGNCVARKKIKKKKRNPKIHGFTNSPFSLLVCAFVASSSSLLPCTVKFFSSPLAALHSRHFTGWIISRGENSLSHHQGLSYSCVGKGLSHSELACFSTRSLGLLFVRRKRCPIGLAAFSRLFSRTHLVDFTSSRIFSTFSAWARLNSDADLFSSLKQAHNRGTPATAGPSRSRYNPAVMETPRRQLTAADGVSPASLSLRNRKRDFESTYLDAGRESSKSRRTTPIPFGGRSRAVAPPLSDDEVEIIDLTGYVSSVNSVCALWPCSNIWKLTGLAELMWNPMRRLLRNRFDKKIGTSRKKQIERWPSFFQAKTRNLRPIVLQGHLEALTPYNLQPLTG